MDEEFNNNFFFLGFKINELYGKTIISVVYMFWVSTDI